MPKENWYPQNPRELNKLIERFLNQKLDIKISSEKIHGLIVPHAGYEFSGAVAGKAYSLLKDKTITKIILLGPSHYIGFEGIKALSKIETPLGKLSILNNDYSKLQYEHSLDNQIPFLQKISLHADILPLVIGETSIEDAEQIAHQFSEFADENTIFIFSTDLSHFLSYNEANKMDKETINIIENLEERKLNPEEACGYYPLLILIQLCKIKNWKPKLVEYKNSGDVIGDKSSVVGYASFVF